MLMLHSHSAFVAIWWPCFLGWDHEHGISRILQRLDLGSKTKVADDLRALLHAVEIPISAVNFANGEPMAVLVTDEPVHVGDVVIAQGALLPDVG